MKDDSFKIRKIHDCLWEIPMHDKMNVPARIYTREKYLQELREDKSLQQLVNVAYLPGIVNYSIAMPDIHLGYGFPIGGVAAMDAVEGVISPGGVGYDINCGVRLLATELNENDVRPVLDDLVQDMFDNIPCGMGISGKIRLSASDYSGIITKGARWVIDQGWGEEDDLHTIEDNGFFPGGDLRHVSKKAIERGKDQLGTLGSGNHFLEIDIVDKLFKPDIAELFGLYPGQVCVLIHSGSRGFGHQICTDYIDEMISYMDKTSLKLPDRQLACAHIRSDIGKAYLSAFAAAVNYAWCNRQVIMEQARRSLCRVLGIGRDDLRGRLVYDVSHNIAKFEKHTVNGKSQTVCVHRKGATRALPAGHELLPEHYRDVGQPVFIPGDMGRGSFVLVGQENSDESFYSCCHGAGRLLSRRKAKKASKGRNIKKELREHGIIVNARGKRTLMEEIPEAYKNAEEVCDIVEESGIAGKVAKLRPIGVLKG